MRILSSFILVLLALVAFLFIGYSHCVGQDLQLLDFKTNEPIVEALILDLRSQKSVSTDVNGVADISILAESDSIEIYSFGYNTMVLSYDSLAALDFNLLMLRSVLILDEVVVSASKWKESGNSVVSQVTKIDREQVLLQNPQTAADLLSLSDQVFIQKSQQGGGSPMIRGFAANRLLYSVDGVRMNNAIFRSGNLQNVINIDPFALQNTEVVYGPMSVLYGSDAVGGVMSFRSKEVSLSPHDDMVHQGSFVARYSSANNEVAGHLDVQVAGKKWGFLTSFSQWRFDHLRQGSKGPKDFLKTEYVSRIDGSDQILVQDDPLLQIPTAYDQFNMMHKLRFRPSDRVNMVYAYHYSATSPYGRYDRYQRLRNDMPRYAEWYYGPQSWSMQHLKLDYNKQSLLMDELVFNFAIQNFGESRIQRDFQSPLRSTREESLTAYSASVDVRKKWASYRLLYGLEWVRNHVRSDAVTTDILSMENSAASVRYPDGYWSSMGLYAMVRKEVSKDLSLELGLRYNRFAADADFTKNLGLVPLPVTQLSLQDGTMTGSLGSMYRGWEDWVFKFGLGSAFRAPNFDDFGKVFDSEPEAVVVPNVDLSPEYAFHGELSASRNLGGKTKIEFTGYFTLLRDAMVRRPFSLDGMDSIVFEGQLSQVQALQNASSARVYGAQLRVDTDLGKSFYASGTFNWQEGREETDEDGVFPSRHAAPAFGVLRLGYRKRRLQIEANVAYQLQRKHEDLAFGERNKIEIYALDKEGLAYAPAWYTVNFKTRIRLEDDWSLSAGVDNITDQRYRSYSSGISGAGRNFVMSVGYRF